MAADKNIKVNSDQLNRFDSIMKNETPLPSARYVLFEKMLDVYDNKDKQPVQTKEVIKYVDRFIEPKTTPNNKKVVEEIRLLLKWLNMNTAYFPSHHSNNVKDVRNKIDEWLEDIV